MGKYGTNLEGFGGFEGGVNSEDGAPLVSTSSDGETALLFGPAALREIQTLVANGDFSIPPDEATTNISSDNPLPYWTVTTTGSTCSAAIVADSGAASGQVLQVTVGAGTGGSLTLSRYIPIPGSQGQTFCVNPMLTMGSASNNTDAELYAVGRQYTQSFTATGSTVTLPTYQFNSYTGVVENLLPDVDQFTTWVDTALQPSAAFYKISITFQNAGTTLASRTIKVFDVRLVLGSSDLTIAESTTPGTYGPAYIRQENGSLNITANTAADSLNGLSVTTSGAAVTGNLSTTGRMTAGNIASANVTITPVANATTGVAVTGLSVKSSAGTATIEDFSVFVTARTAADAFRTSSYSSPTVSGSNLTGLTVNIFRTNTTATNVSYLVIGR